MHIVNVSILTILLFVKCFRQVLLQNGASVNTQDYNNDTPLSWAAMKGNLESIKILLEYNARVDTVNNSGHTPLYRYIGFKNRSFSSPSLLLLSLINSLESGT